MPLNDLDVLKIRKEFGFNKPPLISSLLIIFTLFSLLSPIHSLPIVTDNHNNTTNQKTFE